jgi:hypothetical protein
MLNYFYRIYFGDINAFMNSYYIDYLIKDIRRFNKLTPEEEKLIRKAKIKLYSVCFLNFCFFLYSIRRLYNLSMIHQAHHLTISAHICASLVAISLMYYMGQRLYYNDMKYLILMYNVTEINKPIIH